MYGVYETKKEDEVMSLYVISPPFLQLQTFLSWNELDGYTSTRKEIRTTIFFFLERANHSISTPPFPHHCHCVFCGPLSLPLVDCVGM